MKINRNILIVILIIFNIFLDQISKFWIRKYVSIREDIEIISDYFIITRVENKGAFLGFGSELGPIIKPLLLIVVPVVVLVGVLVYIFRDKNLNRLSIVGLSFIIGGGIANIYDRIILKSVTDFLYIDLGGPFKTGVFNIADLSVTTGMVLYIWANYKAK